MKIKRKLKNITNEEYKKYIDTHCGGEYCSKCVFNNVTCTYISYHKWIKNKDIFSDKFLNQEIELEVPDILNKDEKRKSRIER